MLIFHFLFHSLGGARLLAAGWARVRPRVAGEARRRLPVGRPGRALGGPRRRVEKGSISNRRYSDFSAK